MKQRLSTLVGVLLVCGVSLVALMSLTQAAALSAEAPSAPPSLDIVKTFNIGMPPALVDSQELLTGELLQYQLSVTNNEAQAVNLLVFDEMQPTMDDTCRLRTGKMQTQMEGAPSAEIATGDLAATSDYLFGAMVLELEPGETWRGGVSVPLEVAQPGCAISGKPVVYAELAQPAEGSCQPERSPSCRYPGWSLNIEDVATLINALDPIVGNDIEAQVLTPDLGDAPDSSNHFGVPMTAYPGVQASFPTVYDPATGLPVGPRHSYARPLRLGDLASREREADLNPNRNLHPNINQANLDTRDDGLALSSLTFSHCATDTIMARVTVEQWAIDQLAETDSPAYLNLWVDSNRDGDWEDGMNCGGDSAVEHIVINHPVDIAALGVGTHTISVPTKLVPWPTAMADDVAWVRISLSDTKAPTPLSFGGMAYGDGRGPNGGYTLGETEDYRLVSGNTPPEQLEGADLVVQVDGQLDIQDIPPIELDLASSQMLTHTTAIFRQTVTMFNRGDLLAENTTLIIKPDPALRNHAVEFDIVTDPPLPPDIMRTTCHGSDADCKIEINLSAEHLNAISMSSMPHLSVPLTATLTVGIVGRVLCDPMTGGICSATELTASAQAISSNDSYAGNDSAEKTWQLPRAVDSMLPPSITSPSNGTTNRETMMISGLARPMATVNVYADGWEEGVAALQVMADGQGRWQGELTLDEGPHQIVAAYPNSSTPSTPLNLIVKDSLPFDPLSMTIRDGGSSYQPWGRNGRVDESGWAMQLMPDHTVEMSIDFSGCLADNAGIQLLQQGKTLATFADMDDDGVFTAEFKGSDEELAALRFNCGGQQATFQGEIMHKLPTVTVVDAVTNEPLSDAAIVLWETYTSDEDLWLARRDPIVNGQSNPRFTDDSGEASFFLPPGSFGLTAQIDGYQSYKLPSLSYTGCLTCTYHLKMQPLEYTGCLTCTPSLQTQSQLHDDEALQMALTSDGFSQASMTVHVGEEIEWVNLDSAERGVEVSSSSGVDWDSGALQASDRFHAVFDTPGTYTVVDPFNPATTATIMVEMPAPTSNRIFLPSVVRQ